jgi:hypothetical protein
VVLVGLPELLAVACVEVIDIVATSRLVDVDRGIVPLADTVDQCVCLIKVEQGVQENHVGVVLVGSIHLGEHVEGDKASQSKSSSLRESRQRCDAPFEDV